MAERLSIVRDEKGDHATRIFADIYLGATPIGGLFCSPEHLAIVESVFIPYNWALEEASARKE
jgi:hypothetical protein